ncbi:transposase [Streptomyces sp. NPDC002018]|uniref:transposase n=1 Tax=Streptomyces sp. NPDC002018 TaxID=3364629 RepID=UPI0036832CA2
MLVVDDSGDRKDGTRTAFTGWQWLGWLGKTDNGIVTVTTLWADERLYYPLHALPYSPAHHFPKKRSDPGSRTKPQLAAAAAILAARAGVPDLWSPRVRSPRATRLDDRWLSACTRVDVPGELLGIFGEEFP